MSKEQTIIENCINNLRGLVQEDIQSNWYFSSEDISVSQNILNANITKFESNHWQLAEVNEKGYITWNKGRQVRWLAQKITTPYALKDYPISGLTLRLVLTWWAEDAQIFVNGNLVQQGDLFDSSARVILTNSAVPGDEFLVTIRLVSPGHDIGALMRSKCVYERSQKSEVRSQESVGKVGELSLLNLHTIDPGFVADEIEILTKYLTRFEAENLQILATEIAKLDWRKINNSQEFDRVLVNFRQQLLPLAKNIKQRCFYPLGHAHLDMAWLWTTTETYEVAQRTFQSVLNLQQKFPYLTFGHTTPALYEWIEQNCPDLFTRIQTAVQQGKWEILGGMWVEPEVNLINGESIARQLLYGQAYFQEKFGKITKVAWLPDSFGFNWQLPQLFKQAGIEYFVTGKLHWNDTTKFPLGCFWWESPDGTQLLTLMSPPNVTGVMDTNPITMTNYAVDWESQTGLQDIFWLPGVGDHGGGPTQDMLEVAAKWSDSPFFPRIEFSRAIDYLEKVGAGGDNPRLFPVWKDELYLELHRGCYTVYSSQKRFNSYCEGLLYQAELFTTLASLITKNSPDRQKQQQIEKAWKKVLFNQFHDILPGTSIPEVFVEADRDWEDAISLTEEILTESIDTICSHLTIPYPFRNKTNPIVIFNPLNWSRSEIVSIAVEETHWQVYDLEGNKVPSQYTKDRQLLFLAEDIPSIGYRLFWLCPAEDDRFIEPEDNNSYVLENECIRVTVNSSTGDLDSIWDKNKKIEVLRGSGNQLQAFTDKGQYWDAWNIDPNYEPNPLPPFQLKSIEWLDRGELQQSIRVVRQIGKSEFQQDYILQFNSSFLKIATTVDWQETHVLVKAAFPLNLESDYVTYGIPGGAIERTTRPSTPAEKAKWEVPALGWADLTSDRIDYGVSLISDCKYGYDSQSDRLRLTLLRSPQWPDPNADKGIHQFTYGIYVHTKTWQAARTVHQTYQLKLPLKVVFLRKITSRQPQLPPVGKLLDLSAENLILMAFKSGETGDLILRCYECHGNKAKIALRGDLDLKIFRATDILERERAKEEDLSQINPWQIATFDVLPPLKMGDSRFI
ncbi:MAG: alpha-mannosidase [Xenococcaceae cyanobacterium]